jgi:hypothetical protein
MADDRSNPGRGDRRRVNVNQDYEVDYWSQKFYVSPERLEEAVRKVGPMVSDIQRELARTK